MIDDLQRQDQASSDLDVAFRKILERENIELTGLDMANLLLIVRSAVNLQRASMVMTAKAFVGELATEDLKIYDNSVDKAVSELDSLTMQIASRFGSDE